MHTMTPHDWTRIVARAQEAHRLRRWARLMRDFGDVASARSIEGRACRAEDRVRNLARRAGVPLEAA